MVLRNPNDILSRTNIVDLEELLSMKGCNSLLYKLENDCLKIEISSKGAELMSVMGKTDGYQYLWQGDPQIWGKRSPLLFPIIGNLNQGKYLYRGKEYALGLHGFAAKMDFCPCEAGEKSVTFSLSHDSTTLREYPFEFRLLVTFTLQEKMLTTVYRVENTGNQTLWFSIGGHPGFNCSLTLDGRKNVGLVFEKVETVSRLVNESGYLTGREEPFLKGQNIVDVASLDFDGKKKVVALKGFTSENVIMEDRGNGKMVMVRMAGFPFLGIWSPTNQAPFLCIEPWYGITATFGVNEELDKKQGIQELQAGNNFTCGYDIVCLK